MGSLRGSVLRAGFGAGLTSGTRSSGMRTMLSSAPVKRITRAWITTINSRGIEVQSASSAPR